MKKKEKIYDTVIIGSGPAGLAAAVYAAEAGLDSLVLECMPMSGGQLLNSHMVRSYPGLPGIGGFELSQRLREHADIMNVCFEDGEAAGIIKQENLYRISTERTHYFSRSVVAAAGTSRRHLGIAGEEEFAGRGVSYCAACDGVTMRNKTAAVIGGGDTAAGEAVFLAGICAKVYVIHRRGGLRAAPSLQERLLSLDNVEVYRDTAAEEITGSDTVRQLRVSHVGTGEKTELLTDCVFVAAGMIPNSRIFQRLVDMDEAGYILAGEDCRTSRPGIYAAGDIRSKRLRRIITAAADGANAIASLQEDFHMMLDK